MEIDEINQTTDRFQNKELVWYFKVIKKFAKKTFNEQKALF